MMNIRVLNGGHATTTHPGGLMGITYVHKAMAHPLILGFLNKLESTGIIPYFPLFSPPISAPITARSSRVFPIPK